MLHQLSILLPSYNNVCVELVRALSQQCERLSSLSYEIIVSDDGSHDENVKEENRSINAFPHCKYIEREKNYGRAANRNFLVNQAQYDWVLFLDSDTQICHDFYIERYVMFPVQDVLYGGLYNRLATALEQGNLRYRYEKKFELKYPAKQRNRYPYKSFHTSNTLMRKAIFDHLSFDEAMDRTGYGYEDVIFGKLLQQAHMVVQHIDNPICIEDFSSNADFMALTEKALCTLYQHRLSIKGYNGILSLYDFFKTIGLAGVLSALYGRYGQQLRKYLCGKHPSLLMYDVYRLCYYSSLSKKNSTMEN